MIFDPENNFLEILRLFITFLSPVLKIRSEYRVHPTYIHKFSAFLNESGLWKNKLFL